jgi:iron(III) transport system permease protein
MGGAVGALRSLGHRLERPLALSFATVAAVVIIGLPLAAVLAQLDASAFEVFAAWSTWTLLARSLVIAAAVTAIAVAIGAPLGTVLARAAMPARHVLLAVHVAPGVAPPLVVALGWFHVFGQHGLVGTATTARWFFGPLGVVLVLVSSLTPIVTTFTLIGVTGLDASIEEAGLLVAPPARVLARLLLPAASARVAIAALVVFSLSMAEVAVPMFLRVPVYSAAVFARLGSVEFSPREAAALSLPLIALGAAFVLLERRIFHRAGAMRLRPIGHAPLDLGRAPFVLAALATVFSVAPLASLFVEGAHGASELIKWLGRTFENSLLVGSLAGFLSCVLGVVVGHAFARGYRGATMLDHLLLAGFFLPSAVLGTGSVSVWNRATTQFVYGTSAVIVLGLVARYGALATRVFAASVADHALAYEEAASVSGAGYARLLRQIVLPMNARGLVAAFAVVVLFCLRDVETVALSYPPGGETMTVRLFTLEANGPTHVVAALAALQVAVSLAIAGGLVALARRSP